MSADTVKKSLTFGSPTTPKTQANGGNTATVNIEFENLKSEAKALGVDFAPNIKASTLAERVAAKKLENLKAEATSLNIEFDDNIDADTLSNLIAKAKEGAN